MGVGAGGVRPPTIPGIADSHGVRITELERRRPLNTRPERIQYEVSNAWPSTLSAGTCAPYLARWSAHLTAVVFLLGTAGSTATTFKVYRNGSVLTPLNVDSNMTIVTTTTLSLSSNNTKGVAQFDSLFGKDADILTVEVVSVGTGAASLTTQSRFG